jgi:hypothetical protein
MKAFGDFSHRPEKAPDLGKRSAKKPFTVVPRSRPLRKLALK